MKSYKIDLHTHSLLSYDGAISANDYRKAITSGKLDFIAITDHNEIDLAIELNKELGEHIIIGEEVMCAADVEVIGLFLQHKILPGQSLHDTIKAIKEQGGLAYIPHPLEVRRHGIGRDRFTEVASDVDIIEVFNGRSWSHSETNFFTSQFMSKYPNLVSAASSDGHSKFGLGNVYTEIADKPTVENLKFLLKEATLHLGATSIFDILAPMVNKIKRGLK